MRSSGTKLGQQSKPLECGVIVLVLVAVQDEN
jgi:hypothetical protein